MKQTTDVLIVGGGVIGCSIAYFLRKRGVEVIVLERGDIGAGASSAAAGLLAPIRPLCEKDDFKALQLAGMARLASFIPELEEVSGIAVSYQQTGTLRLLPSDKLAAVPAWAEEWRRVGFDIEVLSAEEAHKREPHLSRDVAGAVSIADEAQVSPPLLMKAYERAARQAGALLYDQSEVIGIQPMGDGGRIAGVWVKRGKQHKLVICNHLIIAAGAWSSQFGEWLHVLLPVRPVRGELIALRQPSPPIRSIIFDEGIIDPDVYLAPKPDGTLLLGATKADVGFDSSVSAGGVRHLLDVATRLLPSLSHCSIERMWAGLRPKTPDSRPMLGRAPSWENVMLACGHGGFGVTLSAITGEAIATFIVTGQAPEIIRPFFPAGEAHAG